MYFVHILIDVLNHINPSYFALCWTGFHHCAKNINGIRKHRENGGFSVEGSILDGKKNIIEKLEVIGQQPFDTVNFYFLTLDDDRFFLGFFAPILIFPV